MDIRLKPFTLTELYLHALISYASVERYNRWIDLGQLDLMNFNEYNEVSYQYHAY